MGRGGCRNPKILLFWARGRAQHHHKLARAPPRGTWAHGIALWFRRRALGPSLGCDLRQLAARVGQVAPLVKSSQTATTPGPTQLWPPGNHGQTANMSPPPNQTPPTPQAQTVSTTGTLQAWPTQPAPAPAGAAAGQPGTQAAAAAGGPRGGRASRPSRTNTRWGKTQRHGWHHSKAFSCKSFLLKRSIN